MHDIKFIRSFPEEFNNAMKKRGISITAEEILELDFSLRKSKQNLHDLQNKRNQLAKLIGEYKSKNLDVTDILNEAESIKKEIPKLEQENNELVVKLNTCLSTLPNLPAKDVPFGINELDNVEVRYHGVAKSPVAKPKQHFELGELLNQMDFAQSAKISGSRFVILKDKLAMLERALANFMLDIHTKVFGYLEISPPILVREHAMFGVGQLPKFSEDSFIVNGGEYRLIPTAEVPLTNLVADMILKEEELPLRFTAYTPCFRSEAGSAGKDTRGMIRLHQFNKVELVSITTPEESEREHELMLNAAEEILKRLELPYRIMLLCSQDMGFSARKTYDIEVWLPGQNCYREISSCSNCGDFQAQRMKSRFKDIAEQQNRFTHTLNGSGLAVGRTIVAILENYQQEDGSILIPHNLRPYMGNLEKIS